MVSRRSLYTRISLKKQQKQKKWQHQNNQLRRDHLVPQKLQGQIANKVVVRFLVRGYLVKVAHPVTVAPPPLLKKVEKVVAVADAKGYPDVLHNRSNVDLKDKYRNLVKYGKIPPVEGDDNTGITDNDVTDDNADADANVGENEH
ncbi:hypothetical protein PHMEG_00025946, partial [Phytophthora megakarya]